jgi:hypothetical protein
MARGQNNPPTPPIEPLNQDKNPKNEKNHDLAILLILGAVIVLIFLIVLIPDLRENRFTQGAAGVLMAFFIAVVFYYFLPLPVGAKVPITVISAGAFFIYAVPPIERLLGLSDNIVEGIVTYRGTMMGVRDVSVSVPNADQSTQTDENGEFTFAHVASGVKELRIRYQAIDTTVTISKEKSYSIIPRAAEVTSGRRELEAEGWSQRVSSVCPKEDGMADPKLYVYQKTFSAEPAAYGIEGAGLAGVRLLLDFSPHSGAVITAAQSVGAANGEAVSHEEGTIPRQWVYRNGGKEWPVRLEFCVARPVEDADDPEIPLRGFYSVSATRFN